MSAETALLKRADALLRCEVADIDQITDEIRQATEALARLDARGMEAHLETCRSLCTRILDTAERSGWDTSPLTALAKYERGVALKRLRSAALVHGALLRRSRNWIRTCESLLYSTGPDYSSNPLEAAGGR